MFKPDPTYQEWNRVYFEVASAVRKQFPSLGEDMLKFLLTVPKPPEPPAPKRRF